MSFASETISLILSIVMIFSAAGQELTAPPETQTPERQTVVIGAETTATAPATPEVDQNEAMLVLVNDLRGSVGAGNLALDPALCEAANIRAKEIAQSFSHTRPDGSAWNTVFTGNYQNRGENIAAGSSGNFAYAAAPFETWKNSSGHYANMINRDFTLIGVGSYSDGRMTYWVQLFAAKG
jgi:uncharacterized protein YkwD